MENIIEGIEDFPEFTSSPEVEYRKLGSTDLTVSSVGLGCRLFREISDADCLDSYLSIIHTALDGGINLIDTSPAFGHGLAEKIIGKVIEERRDDLVVATKCGIRWNQNGTLKQDSSPEILREQIDHCRRRLQTDMIDLALVMGPPNSASRTWETMEELRKNGHIRAIGLCNFSRSQIEACRDVAPIHAIQSRYSMIERNAEEKLWPYCQRHDIAGIACSPLAQGLLPGKYEERTDYDDNDPRKNDPVFQKNHLDQIRQFIEKYHGICDTYDKESTPLSLHWTREQNGVTAAVAGATSEDQILENIQGAGEYASEHLLNQITELLNASLPDPPREKNK